MGKRSKFPRIDKDCYDTPASAFAPLVPFLTPGVRYAEPFAGQGNLIDLLAPHAELVWCGDIAPRRADIPEADGLTCEIGDAEMFITNPPWKRKLLHRAIVHLSDQAPTWLLFDSNWANTQQARPFMERCRCIVTTGRHKWIPESKHAGKDDASWYLFGRPIAGSAPLFWGWRCYPEDAHRRPRRVCHDCGILIDRFGKWRLQKRHGVLTPVHVDCRHPSGPPGEPGPAPLLDWLETRNRLEVVK